MIVLIVSAGSGDAMAVKEYKMSAEQQTIFFGVRIKSKLEIITLFDTEAHG
jgi:hypothetical protein